MNEMMETSPENAHWLDGPSVSVRYLISRQNNNRLGFLTLPTDEGDSLPVFGSEVAARAFLRFNRCGDQWKIRETTAGELISLLMGHVADVSLVSLDPSPAVPDKPSSETKPLGKRDFISTLMKEPLVQSSR